MYKAKTKDGREITGNRVEWEGFYCLLVQEDRGSTTKTMVDPETLEEVSG